MFDLPSGSGSGKRAASTGMRVGTGVAAWGRGFYVWSEDAEDLRDWLEVLGTKGAGVLSSRSAAKVRRSSAAKVTG